MGHLNIKDSFKHTKFKYGGYAAMISIIVLAVVIVLNLVVNELGLKLDLSSKKLYTISDESIKIIKDLKKDVKIYPLFQAGKEDATLKELLNSYTSKSKKLSVQYVDPQQHVDFTEKYAKSGENIDIGGVIVEYGNKFKLIKYSDMRPTQKNGSSQYMLYEQKITNAIMYVTSDKDVKIYTLQGHSEAKFGQYLTIALESQNITVNEVSLATGQWKPETSDILVINAPKRDISSDELAKIKDFLFKGGRGLFFLDYAKVEMPNLSALLKTYATSILKSIVYEGSANNYFISPADIMPTMQKNPILQPLIDSKIPVLVQSSQGIQVLKEKKESVTVAPLLVTTEKAYGKTDTTTQSQEKASGDISGPFNLAVAITDKLNPDDESKNTKIVIFGTSKVYDDKAVVQTNGSNLDLLTNSVNWLSEKKDNITVAPKSLATETLKINQNQALTIAAITVIVIPLIVIVSGIIVWLRRRHL